MQQCEIGSVYHKCREIFRGWNILFNVSHTVYSFRWNCVFRMCCGAEGFVDLYQAYIVPQIHCADNIYFTLQCLQWENLIWYTTSWTSAMLCLHTQIWYVVFVISLRVPWLAHNSWFKHINSVGWEYTYSEFSSWNFLHHPLRFKYCQHCALRAQITCWIRT
jgi:hypothetical protein